jgi:hypothetical protein
MNPEEIKADEVRLVIRQRMKTDYENRNRPFGFKLPRDIFITDESTGEDDVYTVDYQLDDEKLFNSDGVTRFPAHSVVCQLTGRRLVLTFINAGWALSCPFEDKLVWYQWKFVVRPPILLRHDKMVAERLKEELNAKRQEVIDLTDDTGRYLDVKNMKKKKRSHNF